jgi:hypothetical protein
MHAFTRKTLLPFCATSLLLFTLQIAAAQDDAPNMFVYIERSTLSLANDQQRQLERYQEDTKTFSLRIVRLDPALLSSSISLSLNLPDKMVRVLDDIRIEQREQDDFSWFGSSSVQDADAGDEVILTIKGAKIFGTIRSGSELYTVRPLDVGTHVLVQIDQSKFPADHPEEFNELLQQKTSPAQPIDQDSSLRDDCGSFRAIVAYTPATNKNVTDIDQLIQLAVDETNQGYRNSGADTRIELAHKFETNYKESGSMKEDVERFYAKGDGFMDEVHALRYKYWADIALLITASGDGCGRVKEIGGTADEAFGVVRQDCATGYYTFGHEIGHLQGAGHNPEAPTWSPFIFGHGYYFQPGKWRTVMSYGSSHECMHGLR